MANFDSSQIGDLFESSNENTGISASLKFLVSNLRTLVPTQLSTDNYSIWRSQIIKLFRENGFGNFLEYDSTSPSPQISQSDGTMTSNPAYTRWHKTDQNLSTAVCSTISPSVLPCILHLESMSEIWKTLEIRFQSTNRSKVIQLKNELHNVSMKALTMTQYLTEINILVYQIAMAGSTIDNEGILMYILNGMSTPYQAFKTAIRTTPMTISLKQILNCF